MSSIQGTPLTINGRLIGGVVGNRARLFVQDRHWFRAGNGYSVDASLASALVDAGIEILEFYHTKTKKISRIELAAFLTNGWQTKDYGYGSKLVCDSRHYERPSVPQPSSPAPTLSANPQLSFDGLDYVGA
jgi:hypothetical protein